MGNKPNASAALSEEDIQALFQKDLLGSYTAETLLNMVQQHNPFRVTRLQGAQTNVLGRRKTLSKLPQGRSTSNSMKGKPKLVQETIHEMSKPFHRESLLCRTTKNVQHGPTKSTQKSEPRKWKPTMHRLL